MWIYAWSEFGRGRLSVGSLVVPIAAAVLCTPDAFGT